MLKEFFQDMKSYGKESKWFGIKWMKFDFYFRLPVGLLCGLALIIYSFVQSRNREDYIAIATMGVTWLILILLFFLCMIRRKYSFYSLIVILLLQSLSTAVNSEISVWVRVLDAGCFLVLLLYYSKRKEFFKQREAADINKRNAIVGSAIGLLLMAAMTMLFLCIKEHIYLEAPAKDTKCIVSASDDTWTEEQARVVADKWLDAVEKEDVEGIQEIIEEMLIEQEEKVKVLFFFEKSEFQAGLDQRKCRDVLSCIDAKEQGLAYYSLARIGHYYDARASRNHKISVSVQRKEEKICVILQHGRAKTELAFVDMNENVGEMGKAHLYNLNFPEESIITFLSDIYTDEDISFVRELAEASEEGEYIQLFQNNPDELSAYGQDALYIYVYTLMDNSVEYDSRLRVDEENWTQFENFINSILFTRSNQNEKYYCERYLKILEDKGNTYMAVVADQFRQYYDQKNRVIEILPNFGINSQLNILFSSIRFYLDTGISYSKTVQIEELEINNLLNGAFNYKMNIEGGHDKKVELWKDAGTEVAVCRLLLQARGYHSKYDWKEINFTWLMLYGDIIVNHCNSEVVTTGEHDANAILKAAWLEKEGLAKMFGINKDSEADDLLEKARERVGLTNDWYCERYLLLTGKPCLDVNGNPYKIQSFNDIPYYDVYKIVANETDRYFSYDIINDYYFDGAEEDKPFDFFSYDMITDYYLKSEEDEEENNSSATKEEIPEEVMEEDTALQEKEKEDSGKVEGYEYLKQIDLPSADGNVYPVMVPKDFVLEEGDRFVSYYDNGFYLSMYARELFEGETLADFMDTISDFIYEDPDRDYFINVNKTDRIEKDGLIYQICTADGLHSDGTTSPHARLAAAIPLGGTDVLAFHLEYDNCNQEGIKYLEEIGKYYKIPVDVFIELMEENE